MRSLWDYFSILARRSFHGTVRVLEIGEAVAALIVHVLGYYFHGWKEQLEVVFVVLLGVLALTFLFGLLRAAHAKQKETEANLQGELAEAESLRKRLKQQDEEHESAMASRQQANDALRTEIQRQQVIPQFVIREELQLDPEKQVPVEDKITVSNKGGLAYDLFHQCAVFLNVSCQKVGEENREKRVAINGYYGLSASHGEGTGLMLTISGDNNHTKYVQLEREYRQLLGEKHRVGVAKIERYLRLTYRDVLGNEHTDYYEVKPNHAAGRLDSENGKAIFDEHRNGFSQSTVMEFASVTARSLIALFRL